MAEKKSRSQKAKEAGWSSYYQYLKYTKTFKEEPNKYVKWNWKQHRLNPYEAAMVHKNAFQSFGTSTPQKQLTNKFDWLVNRTQSFTKQEFELRYKSLLSELGLSI